MQFYMHLFDHLSISVMVSYDDDVNDDVDEDVLHILYIHSCLSLGIHDLVTCLAGPCG